jgi:4-hydroxybenzoate polyprenyltransferase
MARVVVAHDDPSRVQFSYLLSLALISSTTSHATRASGEVLPYFLDASRAAFTALAAAASVAAASVAAAADDDDDGDADNREKRSRFLATGGVTGKRASVASKGRRRIVGGSRERIIIVG